MRVSLGGTGVKQSIRQKRTFTTLSCPYAKPWTLLYVARPRREGMLYFLRFLIVYLRLPDETRKNFREKMIELLTKMFGLQRQLDTVRAFPFDHPIFVSLIARTNAGI